MTEPKEPHVELASIAERLDEIDHETQRLADERAKLEERRNELQALAQAASRKRERRRAVLDRYTRGEYVVVGISGPWWAEGGQLIERADPDDMEALYALEREGVVTSETRSTTR